MAWLKISDGSLNLRIKKISQYDLSEFSLKNQYTGESGNTIIYPVKMHKKRISVTAEFTDVEYRVFTDIVKNPEFECDYCTPYGSVPLTGIFTVTSDITIVKIIPETSVNRSIYAVSFTIEEV